LHDCCSAERQWCVGLLLANFCFFFCFLDLLTQRCKFFLKLRILYLIWLYLYFLEFWLIVKRYCLWLYRNFSFSAISAISVVQGILCQSLTGTGRMQIDDLISIDVSVDHLEVDISESPPLVLRHMANSQLHFV
jgi:hypothetical protein